MKAPSQWNDPSRVDKLIEPAKAGVIYAEIARQLGTTVPCVKGKLEAMGIKKKHLSPAATEKMREVGKDRANEMREHGKHRQAFNRELSAGTGNISAPRRFSWES